MKKKTKGIILAAFFGIIMLTSLTAATLPPSVVNNPEEQTTITGTPMDNYPDIERIQFCGSSETAKSNTYVKEFKIPTPCTQPVAIVTDPEGNVWFAQTNTGRIAKFDPTTEAFTEYENPRWNSTFSMIWGIDYSPDATLWFTDDTTDGIWKFSIDDKKYDRTNFPKVQDSLPQRLSVVDSKIIVNDFTGNKLTLLDPAQTGSGISYLSIPSPVENSVTGSFAVDSQKNIWYTNWIFQKGGVLVKFNQEKFEQSSVASTGNNTTNLFDLVDIYQFPAGMSTPNGIAVDANGKVWIVDTSSSFFFSFEPDTESFTKYMTSTPQISSYGNYSGIIKNPISRPYWAAFDDEGRLVFNEQTANRIGIFDPADELLIEYAIPSKNPKWADCGEIENCGLAQIFDFTLSRNKIWFTEWVENNIGVIDTAIPLSYGIEVDKQKITLQKGEKTELTLSIIPTRNTSDLSITTSNTALFSDLIVEPNTPEIFNLSVDLPKTIQVSVTASENALPDIYKVLISVQSDDFVISKFVTVIVEQ